MPQPYIYLIRPPRADFAATITPQERALMSRHFGYLEELHHSGVVSHAGRCENGDCGLVLYSAESDEAAEQIMRGDPAVAAGLMRGEFHRYRVALA